MSYNSEKSCPLQKSWLRVVVEGHMTSKRQTLFLGYNYYSRFMAFPVWSILLKRISSPMTLTVQTCLPGRSRRKLTPLWKASIPSRRVSYWHIAPRFNHCDVMRYYNTRVSLCPPDSVLNWHRCDVVTGAEWQVQNNLILYWHSMSNSISSWNYGNSQYVKIKTCVSPPLQYPTSYNASTRVECNMVNHGTAALFEDRAFQRSSRQQWQGRPGLPGLVLIFAGQSYGQLYLGTHFDRGRVIFGQQTTLPLLSRM